MTRVTGFMNTFATAATALGLLLVLSGCTFVQPVQTTALPLGGGVVRLLGWSAHRNLEVTEYMSRRDCRGHLVALVTLENKRAKPYRVDLKVVFSDEQGRTFPEPAVVEEALHPGLTKFEWTSYSPDAEHFLVDVRSARLIQW